MSQRYSNRDDRARSSDEGDDGGGLAFYVPCHRTESSRDYIAECVGRIRELYPKAGLYVIDDASPMELPSLDADVIKSEFPGAGELLPYYYAHQRREARRIVAMHDSCFLHARLPTEAWQGGFRPLWTAGHNWDAKTDYTKMLGKLRSPGRLTELAVRSDDWDVCFGVMGLTNLTFLDKVEREHGVLSILPQVVSTRTERMACERVFGLLASAYGSRKGYMGDIHEYGWGQTAHQYFTRTSARPLEKIWTGR